MAKTVPTQSPLRRVDVHSHFLPVGYRAAIEAAGYGRTDGIPGLPAWDVTRATDTMERLGIDVSVLSISSPGVYFGDLAAAKRLAREVNEDGARLVADYRGRFRQFAVVPLPDVDSSLAEAAYALDVLAADGIALKTNHAGHYLGDSRFDPFFAELDRRAAVVFIHPTSPCCAGVEQLAMGYPRPMIEFFFETTRAVMNLILSGTLRRFPNVRFVIPHAGATLPVLIERIAQLAPIMDWRSQLPRRKFTRHSGVCISIWPAFRFPGCSTACWISWTAAGSCTAAIGRSPLSPLRWKRCIGCRLRPCSMRKRAPTCSVAMRFVCFRGCAARSPAAGAQSNAIAAEPVIHGVDPSYPQKQFPFATGASLALRMEMI